MKSKKSNIAILVVYFGKWPDWTPYFLQSCSENQSIHFIIISDSSPLGNKYTNIEYYKQTLPGLCSLIDSKLGISVHLGDPYKLCDFKPSYGVLFQDYLAGFKFWGYCDIDLIFGNLCQPSFLDLIDAHDIIIGYDDFSSGPFALFRNIQEVNILFKKVKNYLQILSSETNMGFDEHIIKNQNKGFTLKKLLYFIVFIFKHPCFLFNYRLLKYKFQWFYKKNTTRDPVDFSEVLYRNTQKLRIAFRPIILNYADYQRLGPDDWILTHRNGNLRDKKEKDILVFHFGGLKKLSSFKEGIVRYENRESFIITNSGIKYCYE